MNAPGDVQGRVRAHRIDQDDPLRVGQGAQRDRQDAGRIARHQDDGDSVPGIGNGGCCGSGMVPIRPSL